MRITYRKNNIKDYWTSRWDDIPADVPMENTVVYPLKFAEMTIKGQSGKILEAGCGAGRILRYYHNKGMDIVGIDFIDIAIEKLQIVDESLNVEVGDITNLQFDDECFRYILSFGLYHNLEKGLDLAIQETYRVLETGGSVCASFRADNIQTRLTDWLTTKRSNKKIQEGADRGEFHKMNFTRSEFENSFRKVGFDIIYTAPVENMPLLYKFSIFRGVGHKLFDENKARSEGYRLSWFGQKLQNFLMRFFSDQFCNIYVLIASKS